MQIQNNSVFRFSKGMASRHLFTHGYLIRCTTLQKSFLRAGDSGIFVYGLFRSDEMLGEENARRRKRSLAQLRLRVSLYKLVLFCIKFGEGEFL